MTSTEIAYYFRNRWSPDERCTVLELMRCVDRVLTESGTTYIIYGGTLLSYLHGKKLLDYDDDVDFVLLEKTLPESFISLLPNYDLGLEKHPIQNLFKVFFRKLPRLTNSPWSFPFIDLAFGYVEGDHFCHESVYGGVDRFPCPSVLPLRRDFLEGVEVSIPLDTQAVCVAKYGLECLTSALPPTWDHKLARPTGYPQIRVPLEQITAAVEHGSH